MLPEERHLAPEKLISEKTGIEFWRFEDRVLANSNLGLNVPAVYVVLATDHRAAADSERNKEVNDLDLNSKALRPT